MISTWIFISSITYHYFRHYMVSCLHYILLIYMVSCLHHRLLIVHLYSKLHNPLHQLLHRDKLLHWLLHETTWILPCFYMRIQQDITYFYIRIQQDIIGPQYSPAHGGVSRNCYFVHLGLTGANCKTN